jgi:hypothetical protein
MADEITAIAAQTVERRKIFPRIELAMIFARLLLSFIFPSWRRLEFHQSHLQFTTHTMDSNLRPRTWVEEIGENSSINVEVSLDTWTFEAVTRIYW